MRPKQMRQRRDATAALVKRALVELDWTTATMAERLAVTVNTVCRWRRGASGMAGRHSSALVARLKQRESIKLIQQVAEAAHGAPLIDVGFSAAMRGKGVIRLGHRVLRLVVEPGQGTGEFSVRCSEGSLSWTFITRPGDNCTWTTELADTQIGAAGQTG